MHRQTRASAQSSTWLICACAQVPLSYVLPAAAMRALFWARIVLLPLVRSPAFSPPAPVLALLCSACSTHARGA